MAPHTRSADALDKAFTDFHDIVTIFKNKPQDTIIRGWLKAIRIDIEKKWNILSNEMARYLNTELETEGDKRAEYQERFSIEQNQYYEIIGEIIERLELFNKPNILNDETPRLPNLRLPTLSIPTFRGEYANWRSFRDLFSSIIIQNTQVTSVEKLYYLSSYCEGRPRDIVLKYPLESSSFEAAWNALISEYENPRVLITSQLKLLFSSPILKSESASSLRELQNTYNDCITSLQSLGINTTDWGPILVFMATQRLPILSHTLWESSLESSSTFPTWENLNSFLSQRFRTLEAINAKRTSSENPSVVTNTKEKRSTFVKTHHTKPVSCSICSKSDHAIFKCEAFHNWSPKSRYEYVKQNRLCVNCLGPHGFKQCTSKGVCHQCSKRHHSLLHFSNETSSLPQSKSPTCATTEIVKPVKNKRSKSKKENTDLSSLPSESSTSSTAIANNGIVTCFASQTKRVLLATAVVNLQRNGHIYRVRALIDPGSEASFITETLVQTLNLKTSPCSTSISGVGISKAITTNKYASFTLGSKYSELNLSVKALVLKKLVHSLPLYSIPDALLPNFSHLQLADPNYFEPKQIDILLGSDVYPRLIRSGFYSSQDFVGQETIFGYIITGTWENQDKNRSNSIKFSCNVALETSLQKFWEIEEPPTKVQLDDEALFCEEHFQHTHYRRSDGRFVVELPFIQDYPDKVCLGSSRHIALSRLQSLNRSFTKNPHMKQPYDDTIAEYATLNHLTTIDSNEIISKNKINSSIYESFYLPHHGVIKEHSLSTKLRVVFDASCKSSNGVSLNDIVYAGPPLQNQILDVLNNIRIFPFLFNCDIRMMYRQILLTEKHTHFQRILYFNNQGMPTDFKLETVTFGVSCSPYLAMRCLKQLSLLYKLEYPLAASILSSSTYVDDIFGGFYDISTALAAQKQLIQLLSLAKFELHKWVSNHPTLLKEIPSELQAGKMSNDISSLLKTLGILFDQEKDQFTFAPPLLSISYPLTKRKVFSSISKIFDPAGWLAPVFITAKILMQEIWKDGIGWDENISPIHIDKWENFIQSLNDLSLISIPRWFQCQPTYKAEFHGFCDASEKAYAACIYLRIITSTSIVTNLLIAKTKVAPLKIISLPRLELCGAELLSKLFKYIMNSFTFSISQSYAWCDSTIVLAWLAKPSHLWKTFVANRITTIKGNCPKVIWKHVLSKQNPADLASRGASPKILIENSMWLYGPEFLKNEKSLSPDENINETDVEIRNIKAFQNNVNSSNIIEFLTRFSKFSKAVRVFAYILRFTNHKNNKAEFYNSQKILHEEFEKSKSTLIRLTQVFYFRDEIEKLKNKSNISSTSSLKSLNPILDETGILRVNGRLSNLTIPSIHKFPIIVPYQSYLAKLIANHFHLQHLHASQRLLESLIRKSYWIPRLSQLAKQTIHLCKPCYIEKRKIMSQIMAPLPKDRISPNIVFTNVGLDFGGPITLKLYEGRCKRLSKGYICLFVCFVTKAIHLEAVSSLTSKAFLNSLERFISRRGLCQKIYCDNGTNFIGAKNILDTEVKRAIKNATDEAEVFYASRQIKFILNCPSAPHMAGLAEAGIKSVKFHLKRTLGNTILCFEDFATILCRIEACLNSRPLCALNQDPHYLEPLTPGHFIRGVSLLAPPEPFLEVDEESKAFKLLTNLDKLKLIFWNRWKQEYLHTL